MKRALASVDIPAILEPSSLTRTDVKQSDGMSVLPWSYGRCLEWDFTCPDTTAASHLNRAVVDASVVASDAEEKKHAKCASLSSMYEFVPIAVETFGAIGDTALNFMKEVVRRSSAVTLEQRYFGYLMQRLRVAIQRGNAVCVTGTVPSRPPISTNYFFCRP